MCLSPHICRFQEVNILLKYLLTQKLHNLIVTQIALQLASAHSYVVGVGWVEMKM